MPQPTPRSTAGRIAIGPWRLAALIAGAGLALLTPAQGARFGGAPGSAPPDPAGLLTLVRDPGAEWSARADAALSLLGSSPDAELVTSIAALLTDPAADGTAKGILLDAMARTATTPPALFPAVAALAGDAGNEDLPYITPAFGSFRTRESARMLLGLSGPERPPAVRSAAFAALARLSGRDDLGADSRAWQDWFAAATILSEADWREQVAADQARRADRLATRLGAAQQELSPIYRRLYGQLSPSERPRLLAEMLKDEREELRALGFQLAALELSSGQTLPPVVSEAAVWVLADPSAQTRARAAVLLDQLARLEAGPEVIDALNRESDPEAAAALLAASARWPSPVARAAILGWLGHGPATRPAAAKAALALLRADLLSAPEDRAQAAAALRAARVEDLGTAELRLLVQIGTEDDRALVAGLLASSSAPVRLAAAEALSGRLEFLAGLLGAAARDSDLFLTAAESAAAAAPTAASYEAVAALRAPDEESRRAGLLLIAQRLPPADLLTVARTTEDPEFGAALLERLPDLAAAAQIESADAVARSIVFLADLRLRLGQPDRALVALDLFDTLRSRFPGLPTGESADLRATSYLCLDRLDRAAAVDGSAAAWLRGLSLSKDEPHAHAIATDIGRRFSGRLTPDQMVEFALLESQIAALDEEQRARMVGPPAPDQDR